MSASTISTDTPLLPHVIADMVIAEAGPLIEHAPSDAASRLCARAERHYAGDGGPQFAKRLRSKHGREYLHSFMRMWMASELLEVGVSRCQLPYEWGTGGNRPLDLNNQLKD